jgi:hypothetical protein
MRGLFCAFVVALTFSGASLAARETTAPNSGPLIVYVTLTDKGIHYTTWQTFYAEGEPSTAPSVLLRGLDTIFRVSNTGKKNHNFTAFGKKTTTLKPGAKAHFKVVLLARGKFRYESTLDKGKKGFRGVFIVY